MFCFIALTKSVPQNIRGATEGHCLSKVILSQQIIRRISKWFPTGVPFTKLRVSQANTFFNMSLKRYF